MRKQRGVSLIMVLAVIIILSVGSLMFLSRSGDDMGIGASRRDSELAQGLAETAAGLMAGRLNSDDIATADISGNGIADRVEGYTNIGAAPTALTLPYAFYAESGNVTQIIQRVATGESTGTSVPAINQVVPNGTTQMMVNDLFVSAAIRPLLFTQNTAGLTLSANDWTAETARNKAAVWLEYEVNPVNSAWVDVYVAAAARVWAAKAFVRKFIGSYTDQLGGMISPITESAIHGTGDVPINDQEEH